MIAGDLLGAVDELVAVLPNRFHGESPAVTELLAASCRAWGGAIQLAALTGRRLRSCGGRRPPRSAADEARRPTIWSDDSCAQVG